MNAWQLIEPYHLQQIRRTEVTDLKSQVKIKTTRTMLSQDDVTLYNGDDKATYPLIPGRFAVGIVVEGDSKGLIDFESDKRVYLDPISNCKECYACTIGQPKDCSNLRIAGRNTDGFIKDFVLMPFENIYQLPKTVSDDEAVFIEYISLGISVIDKLKIQKGEHVAIIGGNVVGNIIAQLVIYYQAVPILIDDNDSYLEIAKRCGVYYTLRAEGKIEREVSELTGGRMASKVVYVTSCGLNTEIAVKVSRANATLAFAGFNYSNIRVNFTLAMQKQLGFYCITNGYGNSEASINLIANHAVNLKNFNLLKTTMRDIPNAFREADDKLKKDEVVDNCIIDMMQIV